MPVTVISTGASAESLCASKLLLPRKKRNEICLEVSLATHCISAVQVHTGSRTTSAGFVCVHVRSGPPPSLGFPLTLVFHFLFLNPFFPHSNSEKVEPYSFMSSSLVHDGQISIREFILSVELCTIIINLQTY